MRTCPNCGSKMDSSVNFCTNCGSDLRNVPLDAEEQATQMTQATQVTVPMEQPTQPVEMTQPVETTIPNSREAMRNAQATMAAQPETQTIQEPQPQMQQINNQNGQKFDASNMWDWFVSSWKRPFSTTTDVSWYGWVTLLIENILVILGLYICINKYAGSYTAGAGELGAQVQSSISNLSTSVLFEILLYFLLIFAATLAGVFFIRKFVYNVNENFFDVVNRTVSCGNLSTILYLLTFVCLLIGSLDTLKFAAYFFVAAIFIIFLASYTMVVGDSNAVNDKFYGLLLLVVIQIFVIWILSKVFGEAVIGQLQSFLHVNIFGMF